MTNVVFMVMDIFLTKETKETKLIIVFYY